ncbi:hypothetical protein GWI33_018318 [Rhynchophorus ferrugineus]|uniref:Uncharacterized protein n=1 Tax=Rhynchophorus ferrugineus TaxID=354439 RepID=A0A834HU06_RHYFE|nr:hypothetical protein GWI33_018318 [Rhynchophorus ferrugineus]
MRLPGSFVFVWNDILCAAKECRFKMTSANLRVFFGAVWLMVFLPSAKTECYFEDFEGMYTVRCMSTSINEYIYDILQTDAGEYYYLDISYSDFPKIERLVISSNIQILKITTSNVSSVAPDFLNNNNPIRVLDFSHNQLETFFLESRYFPNLQLLDLSHNKIRIFDLAQMQMYNIQLDLGFNRIEEINSTSYTFTFSFSILNLQHNPLKVIHTDRIRNSVKVNVDTLILSGMNLTLPLLNCISKTFQVSALNMSGTLVPSDAMLYYSIENLDLSYSSIHSIGNVLRAEMATTLRYLNLSHNHIETTVVDDLEARTIEVYELDLSFNTLRLTNNSFHQWSALQVLRLANCSLKAVSDDIFSGLTNLEQLNLSGNLLRILAVNSFQILPNLRQLDLSRNLISRLGSETFVGLPSLHLVDLSVNQIGVIETNAFVNVPLLRIVRVARNNGPLSFNDHPFLHIGTLDHLDLSNSNIEPIHNRSLYFAECPILELSLSIRGELNDQSFRCDSLKAFSVVNATIPVLRNRSFIAFSRLSVLKMENCAVDKIEPCALCGLFSLQIFSAKCIFARTRTINSLAFKDFYHLLYLDLSAIGLSDIQARAFYRMKLLDSLDLSHNNLTYLRANAFEGLNALRHLKLENSSIRYCSANAFYGLNSLQTLNLTNNKIRTIDLGTFQHFPSLRELHLSGNKLVEFKVGVFSNLPSLQKLYMARNDISTILTESLWPLSDLRLLDLEYNNLKSLDYQVFSTRQFNLLHTLKIAKNKFRCDYLKDMLVALNFPISQSTNIDYYSDNIDGVDCVDVCKYVLCLKDSHGIN